MKRILLYCLFSLNVISSTSMEKTIELLYEFPKNRYEELYQLYQKMWWTNTRTRDDIASIIEHSLPIALIDTETNTLIGFARIVTDTFKYAFIFDVLLEESYRGKGYGRLLMDAIFNHPKLKRVTVFELHCLPDMVPFYNKFGFQEDFENLKALRFKRVEIISRICDESGVIVARL